MAYVGNTPAAAYTSIAKQDITGNGGASYTLDHAVANENELEVFVNNVRQEPSVAYTVSGTALTMTGNVESSDDFYVVFQGKALQTVTPPSSSVTTDMIVNDAVTNAKIDTMVATKLTGTIDKARMPSAVAWGVECTNGSSSNFLTNGSHYIGNTSNFTGVAENVDTHNAFDKTTGKFTVPVAGVYFISASVTPQNTGGNPRGYIALYRDRSGSVTTLAQDYYYNQNYNGTATQMCVSANVGDTLYAVAQGTNSVSTSIYRANVAGFLLMGTE